jgi:tetratricopeptide (TPR) repeat protein
VVGILTVLCALGTAGADPTPAELTKARSQFQQALALETAGDWAGSLSLLQEVAAVKMTPQVRFNMALCEEHLGRLAMALGDYRLALVEAEGAKAQNVAEQVPGKIDALNARIPKIVIKRGMGAEFATISLDGVSLGPSSIGSEMPVDPGPSISPRKSSKPLR